MAADINQLQPGFKEKVQHLLSTCENAGFTMRPNFTIRTPFEQAKLWRQSRSIEQIRLKISELKSKSAPFLAFCIESAGPQHGSPVTNAIPGLSWHQWGEALDCFWVVDGKAEWSIRRLVNGRNGFKVYAEKAKEIGLDAGGFWNSLKDWPHVQLRKSPSPLSLFSLVEIDARMKELFGS